MLSPAISAMTPPTMARTPRPVQRPTTLLGFSVNQPRLTTCSSSALSKAATSEPNLGRFSGVMMSPSSPRARPRRAAQCRFLGRADRAARIPGALRLDDRITRVGTHVDADLLARQQAAGILAEREQATRREIEHRRRQRAPRGAAVHDHRPRRGGQVGRWGRHQDRRVIGVDRVLAETPPVVERPARQAEQDDRRPDQTDRGVDLARGLERGGVLGRRRGIDLLRGPRRGRRRSRPRGGAGACRCRRSPGARRSTGRPPRTRERRTAGPGRVRGSGPCRRR